MLKQLYEIWPSVDRNWSSILPDSDANKELEFAIFASLGGSLIDLLNREAECPPCSLFLDWSKTSLVILINTLKVFGYFFCNKREKQNHQVNEVTSLIIVHFSCERWPYFCPPLLEKLAAVMLQKKGLYIKDNN